MKNNIKGTIIGWLFATVFGLSAEAQVIENNSSKPEKKETQEIIIRKKGDKDTKVTLEITGNKVIINGKPLAEFSEDGITINNRKIIVKDGNNLSFDFGDNINNSMEQGVEGFFKDGGFGNKSEQAYTFLGVSTDENKGGALITNIIKNSPAEKAGLQKNDIIYKIENKEINTPADLSEVIRSMKTGEKVKIYFLRDGKKKDEKVTLAQNKVRMQTNRVFSFKKPDGTEQTITIPRPPMPPAPPGFEQNWDNNFDNSLFEPRRQRLGLKIQDTEEGNSVKILDVESSSAAASAGLQKDDLITEIAGVKVQNTDEAREQLQINKEKSSYAVKAKRNGNEMSFIIKIPKKLKTANL